jgi:hypothetical protein
MDPIWTPRHNLNPEPEQPLLYPNQIVGFASQAKRFRVRTAPGISPYAYCF